MRSSLLKDIINTLAVPKNLKILIIVLFVNLAIFALGRLYINPHLSKKPCVVCGRPNTKAIATLWQYDVKVIPCCKDVNLWYCNHHSQNAPNIVTEIPSPKDTIAKRYTMAVIGGLLQMVTLFYVLMLMKFDLKYFLASPVIIGFAFLIGNITSTLSLTLLFGSVIGLPLLIFYIWMKKENRQI